jgi:uncharacterized protein (TIGR00661 family)
LNNSKTILICPLDWGLGHASRDIYLIHKLKEKGYDIIIGADKLPLKLLRTEFPELPWIKFPSYTISYSKQIPLALKFFFLLPKILIGIFWEHQKLKYIIEANNIDIVISDNRFGLWNKKIMSVYLTHQINIKFPKGLQFLEYFAYLINKAIIRRFDLCWIPDVESANNLSGELTHKYPLPSNAAFVGILSRFIINTKLKLVKIQNTCEILAILSGPEPQRTILEEKIISQLKSLNKKSVVVLGKPGLQNTTIVNGHVTIVTHLSQEIFKFYINHCDFVICRSGYSIIMDLVTLKKSALIIPTPGQTEQEYLGNYLHNLNLFVCMKQKQLNIKKGLIELEKLKSPIIKPDTSFLEKQLEILPE